MRWPEFDSCRRAVGHTRARFAAWLSGFPRALERAVHQHPRRRPAALGGCPAAREGGPRGRWGPCTSSRGSGKPSRPPIADSTSPATRIRSSGLPSASGASRSTGRPRGVIPIVSPRSTRRSSSLARFLSSRTRRRWTAFYQRCHRRKPRRHYGRSGPRQRCDRVHKVEYDGRGRPAPGRIFQECPPCHEARSCSRRSSRCLR